jgi:hypothetical membrane protein
MQELTKRYKLNLHIYVLDEVQANKKKKIFGVVVVVATVTVVLVVHARQSHVVVDLLAFLLVHADVVLYAVVEVLYQNYTTTMMAKFLFLFLDWLLLTPKGTTVMAST